MYKMLYMYKVAQVALLLLPFALCSPFESFFRGYKAEFQATDGADPGQPLFLTPYIKNGDIATAHEKSEVTEKIAGLTSYSGFFTVNETYHGNMFFWFFPAKAPSNPPYTPLIVWLQGGPGGSSLFGLFNENGPLVVDANGKVSLRDITWATNYHVLYIDNPVGTGFSFTDEGGFCTNEEEVANNLYSALTQFFTVFEEYQQSEFYVTGESYGGKYVPAISYKIHTENMKNPAIKINLKGLAIGDGWCDPENMMNAYADLMYEIGMADENQREYIRSQTEMSVQYIKNQQYDKAREVWGVLFGEYFTNITGTTNTYNYLRIGEPEEYGYYVPFINMVDIRRAIHVGNLSYGSQSGKVNQALGNDFMHSIRDWLSVLMDNYKVMLYNGQLDIIVGPTLTESMLQVLDWSGKEEYLKADKVVWKIRDDVAGYVRVVGGFVQAIVRGGGHILPHDQPERSYDLINRFIALSNKN